MHMQCRSDASAWTRASTPSPRAQWQTYFTVVFFIVCFVFSLMQAGPMFKVKIPKDNDGKQKAFGFVCFKHEVSVPYGMNLLNGATLFGRTLKIQFRAGVNPILII
uniref:RNA-binding protein 7 n=1 Tax=Salmo salar TaxID=8030 RepID=B5X3H1_SALSA|nr:RNA-binding protein 7 [Salmo salar]